MQTPARITLAGLSLAIATVAGSPGRADPAALTFDAADVGPLRSGEPGELLLPPGEGPFPAVIILHGCDGVSAHVRAWARRLARWDYAALVIDSFTPRGVANVCNDAAALPAAWRARDAAAGAAYLRTLASIDPDRLAVVGFSHGANSALQLAPQAAFPDIRPKAIVAFYPACGMRAPPLGSDVMILIGDADDWTPAQRCIDVVAKYAEAPHHRPQLKVYPGATHSFDSRAGERTYLGHHMAYDAAAAGDAIMTTREFLDQHLRR